MFRVAKRRRLNGLTDILRQVSTAILLIRKVNLYRIRAKPNLLQRSPGDFILVTAATLGEPNRRDFLYLATGAVGAVATGAVVWPLIDQMNPDASTLAQASTEVDIAAIAEGQIVTIKWRGKPVFVRHRTPKEIQEAQAVPLNELRDPATDQSRVQKPEWLIVIGICTHLGCVPLGHEGQYDGWLCPCHGSVYDTSGRIRQGPAPYNLALPAYKFLSDSKLQIG